MHAKHGFEVERALLSIIISPLKALMKDQVCSCEEGIPVMQNIAGGFRAFSSYWRGNTDVSIITGENGSGIGQYQDYQSRGKEHP